LLFVYRLYICVSKQQQTMKKGTDLKTKCIGSLKEISPSLTTKDKREAAEKFHVHYNTVLNYLRGEVGDIDTGLKMVEFFNKRISDRMIRVHKILAA
jgi:hypothetical protein